MNWLFPLFLAGAAAAVLPLALHFLRRRPRRPVVFPSLVFLAARGQRTENVWQRIRRWLVLLLRCAVFALLAAAFARPFQGGDLARPSRAVAVIVDNSFSLQAKGRWPALRDWAQKKIGTFAPGDKLGVMLMAPQPTWLLAPTTDTDRALHDLWALSPGWLAAHVEPSLRMAGDALAAIPADQRQIVLFTDQQRLSWLGTDFAKKLPPGVEVVFPDLPAPVEHQAAVLAPTLTPGAQGIRATVSVHNFTGAQKRVLRVYRDGATAPLREQELDLAPREVRTVALDLPGETDRAAWFRFSLDADDLAADDSAYAVWQPAGGGALLLDPPPVPATGANPDFVAAALDAAGALKPALKITPVPAGEWPVRAVAVLRNDHSFAGAAAAHLDAFLAAGGSAVILATGGPTAQAWLGAHGVAVSPLPPQEESWQVHDWSLEHPLVAALSHRRLEVLLRWEFHGGWGLPTNAVTPLAHWTDAMAAIGEQRVGPGRILICGFTPDRQAGDWPVLPSFVPFLHLAPAYLFAAQQSASVVGETGRPLSLGDAGQWKAADGPSSRDAAIAVSGILVPLTPGVFELTHGSDRKLFAVNLPPEESDLAGWNAGTPWLGLVAPQPAPGARAPRARLAAVEAEQHAPLWWWCVAAAAMLLLVELTLANRTTR